VRPVNLLPADSRPRASGRLHGGANVVVGVLATLLAMVAVYTFTVNQANSRKTDIASTKREAADAKQRARTLSPYARFARIKATRLQSMQQLAGGRFDWERMMRELALVLPEHVWLTDLSASTAGQNADSGQAATSGSSESAGGSPSVSLTGCAGSQPDVATMMVRLRKLYRATDVKLDQSAEQGADDSGAGGASSGGSDSASSGTSGCPDKRFQFSVNVEFSPTAPAGSGQKVRPQLGGGS
jgi:Tfp pilus assembly protein PilN